MKKSPDYIFAITVGILLILGIVILASCSTIASQEKFGNTYHYLSHQLIFGILPGLFLAYFFYRIPLSFLKKKSFFLLLANLILLFLVFVPKIGANFEQGANRWINLGPILFQPSEFLKISFILYLGYWLKKKGNFPQKRFKFSKNNFLKNFSLNESNKTLIAFLAILGVAGGLLILQPDISTLGVICSIGLIMYFLAGAPIWHLFFLISGGLGMLILLIKIAPYRMARFLIFLKPELYPMGIGYHLKQSLIAVGSGGVKGLGLGLSRQRFGFLPGAMSDSVFAVFSEETGFIGSFILILLFMILLSQGFKIAKRAKDKSLQLMGFGITSWLVIQAFVNIGAMIRIVPLTGIPLPFISYGGSAIITELIGVGILLNISKQSKS